MMIPGRASLAVAALGVAATVAVSCGQPREASSVAASVDALMTDLHERGLFNGAVVVGRRDEILYECGFGMANVAEGVPFTPGTSSNGASMAKTLTAAAMLMLQEDGLIDLDDPVTKYLPEFPYPEITVRHLITHRSGLHPDNVYFTFLAPEVDTWTNEGLLEILIEHKPPLAFSPGSSFEYSGTGYNMAAILMERVKGTSYASFLQERIFDPLAMDSSFVKPAETSDWPDVRTLLYRRTDDGVLEDFAAVLGVYEMDLAEQVSIENPPPDWWNIGWALDDGWFAPLVRVNGGLRYNMFPVDNGILYVPGLDAWIGFTEGDNGPVIHWTTVFEGTRTGTRVGD